MAHCIPGSSKLAPRLPRLSLSLQMTLICTGWLAFSSFCSSSRMWRQVLLYSLVSLPVTALASVAVVAAEACSQGYWTAGLSSGGLFEKLLLPCRCPFCLCPISGASVLPVLRKCQGPSRVRRLSKSRSRPPYSPNAGSKLSAFPRKCARREQLESRLHTTRQ